MYVCANKFLLVFRYFVASWIRFDAFEMQNVQLTRLWRMIFSINSILKWKERDMHQHIFNHCAIPVPLAEYILHRHTHENAMHKEAYFESKVKIILRMYISIFTALCINWAVVARRRQWGNFCFVLPFCARFSFFPFKLKHYPCILYMFIIVFFDSHSFWYFCLQRFDDDAAMKHPAFRWLCFMNQHQHQMWAQSKLIEKSLESQASNQIG